MTATVTGLPPALAYIPQCKARAILCELTVSEAALAAELVARYEG